MSSRTLAVAPSASPTASFAAVARIGSAHSQRGALLSVALATLLASLNASIANVALPALTQAFATSFQAAQWIVLSYLLAITTLVVSAGRLGDLFGRRRLFLVGVLAFTFGAAACGVAPTLPLLWLGRTFQGLGAAVMMALTFAFVGEIVPPAKTGRSIGLLGTMSAVGTALGPSAGGLLISAVGWSAVFLVSVPLGLLTFLLARRYLPLERAAPTTSRPRFDFAGTLLLAFTLAAYALAMTLGRGRFDATTVSLLAAAAIGGVVFGFAQNKTSSPLVRLELLRDPVLAASLATSAIVSTVMMATLVVGPFYLARALGLDAATVGLILSAGPFAAALTSAPAGRAVDRIGTHATTVAGLLGVAAGALLLVNLPASSGVYGYLGAMVAMTASYALFQTANNTAVMNTASSDKRGVVSGLLNLSRNLGLVTGASAMGAVFARASHADDVATAAPAAVATGMRATFLVAALLIAFALALVAASRTAVSRTSPPSRG